MQALKGELEVPSHACDNELSRSFLIKLQKYRQPFVEDILKMDLSDIHCLSWLLPGKSRYHSAENSWREAQCAGISS